MAISTKKISAYKHIYWKYRSKARSKKTPFEISFEFFLHLVKMPCYICGKSNSNKQGRRGTTVRYNGLDRVNNSKGYIEGNVMPCCKTCNKQKLDHNLEDYFLHIARILKSLSTLIPLSQPFRMDKESG